MKALKIILVGTLTPTSAKVLLRIGCLPFQTKPFQFPKTRLSSEYLPLEDRFALMLDEGLAIDQELETSH
jgi:hypothetical protein